MKIIIRRFNEDDVKQYRQLRLEALKNHPEAFASSFEEEILYDESLYIQRLKQESTYSIGAFDGDTMVGMAVFVPQTKMKISHMSDIFSFYVTPSYRKHNLGYLMIQNIINYAKQLGFIEQIKLSVTATNHDAIRLYERCGFARYATDPKVSKLGDQYYDSILMILYL